eukprot:gene6170-7145_t
MGVNKSTLRTEEIEELQGLSKVCRFKRLDKEEKGNINVEDFAQIPELSMNPLLPRLIAIFDVNRDGQINFAQSTPIELRPKRLATATEDPLPQNVSMTVWLPMPLMYLVAIKQALRPIALGHNIAPLGTISGVLS